MLFPSRPLSSSSHLLRASEKLGRLQHWDLRPAAPPFASSSTRLAWNFVSMVPSSTSFCCILQLIYLGPHPAPKTGHSSITFTYTPCPPRPLPRPYHCVPIAPPFESTSPSLVDPPQPCYPANGLIVPHSSHLLRRAVNFPSAELQVASPISLGNTPCSERQRTATQSDRFCQSSFFAHTRFKSRNSLARNRK